MRTASAEVEVRDMIFAFGDGRPAVMGGLNFTMPAGAFWTLFGHNGSGKTTLLNLIAGVLEPTSGTVRVDGSDKRLGRVGYMFQDFRTSLLPWRSGMGNIAFGLEARGEGKEDRERKVQSIVADIGIGFDIAVRPHHLSGGEQQLLAYARTLVLEPRLVVMDEPFSALDARARRRMRDHLRNYWQKTGATILVVTHDLDEAIYLGQSVMLLGQTPVSAFHAVPVTLPAERSADDLLSDPFAAVRRHILHEYGRLQA